MDTCTGMAESLCCSPGAITTLLMSYAPVQNKKLKKEVLCRKSELGSKEF